MFLLAGTTSVWLAICPRSSAWQRDINGPGASDDKGNAVVVDSAGDIVAAGRIASNERADFAVVKLAGATGVDRWRRVLSGRTDAGGEANAVAVDAHGDIVAAGYVGASGKSWGRFAVIKLKGTGAEIWRRIICGQGGGDSREGDHRCDRHGRRRGGRR